MGTRSPEFILHCIFSTVYSCYESTANLLKIKSCYGFTLFESFNSVYRLDNYFDPMNRRMEEEV